METAYYLSATSTAEEYAAVLAGGHASPTEVELAALTHCLAFSVTVYDSTGLQVGYYSSTVTGAEACLVRTTAADGIVAYCPVSGVDRPATLRRPYRLRPVWRHQSG